MVGLKGTAKLHKSAGWAAFSAIVASAALPEAASVGVQSVVSDACQYRRWNATQSP